ncbi:PhoH family protein [Desulfosporosinus sp. BICA1-9]|uniref:PhoH family protein n=1 Tax=Desulfosporosinus sp. BICA1-9 TaxID=1531958 RepID=UPI00054B4C10|nr:PhoH family protein [Desulfosporosinus sp. BICA1-9]KJS46986.1 MAG: PhoH family protein [Peptococcaceae bacterium BRH_c23]KJS88725.1 MAG: PhoH family protein [Desulfosporosinus sp. BICA1-9]HBW37542.1 PhoH family protein [Desulfosporosinus sp.]
MQKVYVLDSSVLLHDPNAIFLFQDNEVIIPYVVLEEIESKKRLLENVGRAAREAIRNLDRIRDKGKLSQGVFLPNGGTIRIELNHYSHEILPVNSNLALADNRILAVSLSLTREEQRPVILVTKDIAMRVKADALGIVTDDYFNDKVVLPPIMEEVVLLEINDSEVAALYQNKYIPLQSPLAPNRCVKAVLSDDSVLPLVSSPNGERLVYRMGKSLAPWDIRPRNLEQSWTLEMLNDPEIKLVNLMGPAGTGKTLLALASGLEQTVHSEVYVRMLCARPIVPFGKDIGFLPGEKDQKIRPYMQPIYDNLEFLLRSRREKERERGSEAVVDSAIDLLIKKRQLEIEVLTYIRGRSIPHQFIIIDEAQNLSAHEVKTIITRAGEGTKIVLCGDPDQIDHPYLDKESNGLAHLASRLNGQSFYGQVRLVRGERSELASRAAELL